jgi:hypothetical protein
LLAQHHNPPVCKVGNLANAGHRVFETLKVNRSFRASPGWRRANHTPERNISLLQRREWCAHILLDAADIVGGGDISTVVLDCFSVKCYAHRAYRINPRFFPQKQLSAFRRSARNGRDRDDPLVRCTASRPSTENTALLSIAFVSVGRRYRHSFPICSISIRRRVPAGAIPGEVISCRSQAAPISAHWRSKNWSATTIGWRRCRRCLCSADSVPRC